MSKPKQLEMLGEWYRTLLRKEMEYSGLSVNKFAGRCLGRSASITRLYLNGKRPIPFCVRELLDARFNERTKPHGLETHGV